jgi:uncharacterized membrane protein
MEPIVLEWLNLVARWVHVMAAIMWIGDSFLFMWMDRSLVAPTRPREGAVVGELWMVHSGGFYEVVKRRSLAPDEMPATLHWFKWQAYTTWLSGIFLLVVVYYLGRGVYLVDADSRLSPAAAVALSVALLVLGWLVYDAIWRSPLAARSRVAAAASLVLLALAAWGTGVAFSARASFLQLGAMLGTIMVANVWRVIMPAQRAMLAATRAGRPVDTAPGLKAKARSTHNHYLTFPVLFTMLSHHFPSTYGHPLHALVLVLLIAAGMSAKYVMNARGRSNRWVVAAGVASLATVVTLTVRASAPSAGPAGLGAGAPVPFAEAQAIVERRCVACHAAKPANPSFPQPPLGVTLERPEELRRWSDRMLQRAVVTKTMPLGNLTGMTDAERRTLGAWIAQGARLDGAAR